MIILIFGLPGAGKSYLAEKLEEQIGPIAIWYNADKIRESFNDWDFSEEGRNRQADRMKQLCQESSYNGYVAIADFVCPYYDARRHFGADYIIHVDTIKKSRYEDTNKAFMWPLHNEFIDYTVTKQRDDEDAKIIYSKISKYIK